MSQTGCPHGPVTTVGLLCVECQIDRLNTERLAAGVQTAAERVRDAEAKQLAALRASLARCRGALEGV